jgi:hypothetical protein
MNLRIARWTVSNPRALAAHCSLPTPPGRHSTPTYTMQKPEREPFHTRTMNLIGTTKYVIQRRLSISVSSRLSIDSESVWLSSMWMQLYLHIQNVVFVWFAVFQKTVQARTQSAASQVRRERSHARGQA